MFPLRTACETLAPIRSYRKIGSPADPAQAGSFGRQKLQIKTTNHPYKINQFNFRMLNDESQMTNGFTEHLALPFVIRHSSFEIHSVVLLHSTFNLLHSMVSGVYSACVPTCSVENPGDIFVMRAQKVLARDFQFYFPDLDNIILVECHEDESVTIRASKNNVPDERKIFFIRKLATEGFIPDHFELFLGSTDGSQGVLWIKDYSWLKETQVAATQKTCRCMKRALVAACVLWLAMMRILLVSDHKSETANPGAKTPRAASLIAGQPLAELQSQHQPVARAHATGNPPLGAAVLEKHRAENLDQN